jgi:hypothetical protein
MNKATDVIRIKREKYSTFTFIGVCRLQLRSPKEFTDLLNRQNYAWIQLYLKTIVEKSWTPQRLGQDFLDGGESRKPQFKKPRLTAFFFSLNSLYSARPDSADKHQM